MFVQMPDDIRQIHQTWKSGIIISEKHISNV